jgi:multidrug efflux pump subunit AcrB
MRIVPLVVSVALAISLLEAFWMLPAHVVGAKVNFQRPSRIHRRRLRGIHWIRIRYTRVLIQVLRYPKTALAAVVLMMAGAAGALASGFIQVDFFANDPLRLFYVNVEMPIGTPLEHTLEKILDVERKVAAHLKEGETRAVLSYAGQMITDTAPRRGDHYGQVMVGLQPWAKGLRQVDEVIEAMRADVLAVVGPRKVSFLRMAGGPPAARPISIKVRGDDLKEAREAVTALKSIMAADPAIKDITDDDALGLMELTLRVNQDAARRSGVDPAMIARAIGLLVDGEVVASMQDRGETLDVRVRAHNPRLDSLDELLRYTLPLPGGEQIPIAELVNQETRRSQSNIRHYDFRRTITVEADIDKELIDTLAANEGILAGWDAVRDEYPSVNLDFSGELDDIEESLNAVQMLFLLGLGLIYLILGTQFKSYFQPLMILTTVPMAFTGVVLGLLLTGNPASLFTLYGVVALAGIAVNSAIVLISAANARLDAGMSVLHATLYASRRRVIPILITSLTTIAGLFSLATGLAGHSLIWGPVATAIVWGLGFSTLLTLLVVPLLYRSFMARSWRVRRVGDYHAP